MTDVKLTSEHVKKVNELLNIALEMKNLLRLTSPNHNLDANGEKSYQNLVKALDRTISFLSEGILAPKKSAASGKTVTEEVAISLPESNMGFDEFQKRTESVLFIVSSASNKNVLKKMGVPPLNILETGGPLTLEDASILKPDLPEQARIGIGKRIEAFWQQIAKRIDQVTPKQLLLVMEADQESDKLIGKHAEEFTSKFSILANLKLVPSLKDLHWKHFSSLLS